MKVIVKDINYYKMEINKLLKKPINVLVVDDV